MKQKDLNEIKQIIEGFNRLVQLHLPVLESEIEALIERKSTNTKAIEYTLNTLLSLILHGFGDDLFIRLLEYYKTIDVKGAMFYWNEYDKL